MPRIVVPASRLEQLIPGWDTAHKRQKLDLRDTVQEHARAHNLRLDDARERVADMLRSRTRLDRLPTDIGGTEQPPDAPGPPPGGRTPPDRTGQENWQAWECMDGWFPGEEQGPGAYSTAHRDNATLPQQEPPGAQHPPTPRPPNLPASVERAMDHRLERSREDVRRASQHQQISPGPLARRRRGYKSFR